MIQTTKLPTDVSSQSNELLRLLDEVKQEQNAPELIINDMMILIPFHVKRDLLINLDKEDILKQNISSNKSLRQSTKYRVLYLGVWRYFG
ncbi:MAG: hypothetical protein ACLUMQ_00230 [Streptococcus salivarius]